MGGLIKEKGGWGEGREEGERGKERERERERRKEGEKDIHIIYIVVFFLLNMHQTNVAFHK